LLQGRVSIAQLRQLVRPDFTQAIDSHWRSRMLEWNRLGVVTTRNR